MKLRTSDPLITANDYAHALKGLSVNLLVRNIDEALRFQTNVIGATVVYSDPDMAIVRAYDSEWMLHADHAYDQHAIHGLLAKADKRGAGAELRLHGCDPDKAEAAARATGYHVLAPTTDKPHGLREAYIMDADGYVWVPDVKVQSA